MGLSWLAKCTGYLVLFGEPLFMLVNVTHVASDADLFAKPFQTWQLLGWPLGPWQGLPSGARRLRDGAWCVTARLAAVTDPCLPKPRLSCDRVLAPLWWELPA